MKSLSSHVQWTLVAALLLLLRISLLAQIDNETLEKTKLEADAGCAISARQLGEWFEHGAGVPQDITVAAKWYRKAAELGDEEGQAAIGSCYYDGLGVPQNYAMAYVWLSLAAAHGGVGVTEIRDKAAKRLSPEQLSEAQKEAARLSGEIERKQGVVR